MSSEVEHISGLKKLLAGSSTRRAEAILENEKSRKKFLHLISHKLTIDPAYAITLRKGSRSDAHIISELKRMGSLPEVYALSCFEAMDGKFSKLDAIFEALNSTNSCSTLFSCFPGHLLFWYGETKHERQIAFRPNKDRDA